MLKLFLMAQFLSSAIKRNQIMTIAWEQFISSVSRFLHRFMYNCSKEGNEKRREVGGVP